MWHHYQKYTPQLLIGLFISALIALSTFYSVPFFSPFLERLNRQVYDLDVRNNFLPPDQQRIPPIILVDIDDTSIASEEGWPWPRERIARLIEAIGSAQPTLIVLNEVFASNYKHPLDSLENMIGEKDSRQNKGALAQLMPLYDSMDHDLMLTNALQRYQVVLGSIFHQQQDGIRRENHLLANGITPPVTNLIPTWQANGYTANTAKIQKAAKGEGHMTLLADPDGVVRSIPLVLQYDNALYPAISLAAAQQYFLADSIQVNTKTTSKGNIYTGITLANRTIRTNSRGEMLIPYSAQTPTFTKIPALDILTKQAHPALTGSIILIGSSASLLSSNKSTPIRADMSNFEIQAHALQAILHSETIWYTPDWEALATVWQIVLISLMTLLLYPLCRPHNLLLLGGVLVILVMLMNILLRITQQTYLPVAPLLLLIIAMTLLFLVTGLFRESRSRSQLQHIFGQYVPPEYIQQMLIQPQNTINFAGERREMSVLFADLHHFTAISERLTTQELKLFLNRYLTPVTEIIFQHRGTIDKYIGDLVMAFWGAPSEDAQHAQQAVLCALALQQMLQDKKAEFAKLGVDSVRLGIGINTGFMNVGEMGSDYRRAYTVIGDAVNLAARIEPLTRFYQVDILVSEETKQQCPDIIFRTIDRVQVKGKTKQATLYQPLAIAHTWSIQQQHTLLLHEQALQAYWQRQWQQAADLFQQLNQVKPDDPIPLLYLQRISELTLHPPSDHWQGIYAHATK